MTKVTNKKNKKAVSEEDDFVEDYDGEDDFDDDDLY